MLNNVFMCDGFLTYVNYYRGGPGSVYLDVWRPVSENVYTLIHKMELRDGGMGIQTVQLPRLYVKRGDFLGLHYPRSATIGAVRSALKEDNLVQENELYFTYNLDLYDDQIREDVPVDVTLHNAGRPIARTTFALQVGIQSEGRVEPTPVHPTLYPPQPIFSEPEDATLFPPYVTPPIESEGTKTSHRNIFLYVLSMLIMHQDLKCDL